MIITIALVLFYLLTPILLIYLVHVSKTINKIGAVVMAYIIGLVIGNIGLFPRASAAFKAILEGKQFISQNEVLNYLAEGKITQSDLMMNQIVSVQDTIMSIAIPIALPLLLFSLDIKRWLKMAKEALLSLILGVSSLIIVVVAGYFLFKDQIPES